MQIPNDATILKPAKSFASKTAPPGPWNLREQFVSHDRRVLDDRDRRRYLTRAREQLLSEHGET